MKRKQAEQVPLGAIIPCDRCGQLCQVREPSSAAKALRATRATKGFCAECAAHRWMLTVDGLRWAFERGPGVLARADVQQALERILAAANAQATRIDWQRLIANWDLPWPEDCPLPSETSFNVPFTA